jgi:hypothetical protein
MQSWLDIGPNEADALSGRVWPYCVGQQQQQQQQQHTANKFIGAA